jgi:hypothetical protein
MKTYSPGPMTCPNLLIPFNKLTKGYYRVIELVIKGEENREKKKKNIERGGITKSEYRKRCTALHCCPDA